MQKYINLFIVLTYINSTDLIDFLKSTKNVIGSFKVIVVNSYHDDITKKKIETIAYENNCDFLNVENKGYSYGNNRGIQYALEHYEFDYITVSNADIIIKKYNTNNLPNLGVFAGVLIARNGKNQNPMLIKKNKLSEKLIYLGFKQKNKIKIYFGIGLNRIIRETFLIFHKNMRSATENVALKLIRIFQAHGSFITFSEEAIKRLWNGKDVNYTGVFDENMFLFSEEGVIARRAELLNVPVYYSNFAICDHKEDGSMKISGLNLNSELTKSNIYYYERYCMRKNRNIKFYD